MVPWKCLLFAGLTVFFCEAAPSCLGSLGRGGSGGRSGHWNDDSKRPGDLPLRSRLPDVVRQAGDSRFTDGVSPQAVVYQDLAALLAVAVQGQQRVIQKQQSRMDRLLAEFAEIKQELESDDELQELWAERNSEKSGKKRPKGKKKAKKKAKQKEAHAAKANAGLGPEVPGGAKSKSSKSKAKRGGLDGPESGGSSATTRKSEKKRKNSEREVEGEGEL
mmetsp:Transcript_30822/g.55149  ORF Transcript_30822/g.55149 Transcript_30822/m.55149 type:complete len:219 (+) Transcript_30822:24-680(+)